MPAAAASAVDASSAHTEIGAMRNHADVMSLPPWDCLIVNQADLGEIPEARCQERALGARDDPSRRLRHTDYDLMTLA